MAFLNALERHDDRLVDYIFKRIEFSLAYESDVLTANMVMIYRYDVIKLAPRLQARFSQLQIDTSKARIDSFWLKYSLYKTGSNGRHQVSIPNCDLKKLSC